MNQEHQTPSHHHIIPLKLYLAIGATLLILTLVTVASAQIDFGHLLGVEHVNIVLAMVIATIKASLVALFFMHLFWDNKIYMTVFIVSLVALGIFVTLTMSDTLRRADIYEIEGGTIQKQAKMYENRPTTPVEGHESEHGSDAPAH